MTPLLRKFAPLGVFAGRGDSRASDHRSLLRIALGATSLIAACSSDDGREQVAQEAAERAEILSRVADSGSDLERRVLRDGAVTEAEHEESALALVACAEREGVEIQLGSDDDGGYNFTVAADPRTTEIFEGCHRDTYADVSIIYAIQRSMPPEARARQAELVVECLNREGQDVDSWPDTDRPIDEATEARCVDEANAALAAEG